MYRIQAILYHKINRDVGKYKKDGLYLLLIVRYIKCARNESLGHGRGFSGVNQIMLRTLIV